MNESSGKPVQYKLLSHFYGVEGFVDYAVPLLDQIDQLYQLNDEFSMTRTVLDLDIWYSHFYDSDVQTMESVYRDVQSFLRRRNEDYVFARYLPDKQYSDELILTFIK